MKQKLKGSACLLLATVIWGNAFVAQSVGMDYIGPFTFQVVRCALAVIFLAPITFLCDAKTPGLQTCIRHWKDPKLWKAGMICGCALFVAASLQQIGLIDTDAGKSGFLTAMYIVLVPIFGIFIGRKPPKAAIFSVVLAVIGLYFLSFAGMGGIRIGDLALVGCAAAFAVQILCIDRFAGEVDGLRLNCVQALTVTVISIPFMLFTETVRFQNILDCWLPLIFAGVLSMGVAYSLQIYGQKLLEPTTASLLMSTESVFALLGGCLLLNETMTVWEIAGCILMFSAVLICQLPSKPRKSTTSASHPDKPL